MFCSSCGSELVPGAHACAGCGAAVVTTTAAATGAPAYAMAGAAAPPYATPAAAQAPAAGVGGLDHSRAWLLAVVPLLLFAIDAGFLFAGVVESNQVSWGIALAVNAAVSVWDSRYLKSRGYSVSTALAVLLVPGYLYQRSKALGLSQTPLVGWLVAFVVAVVGGVALASHFVTLDMTTVQTDVQKWVDEQAQTTATVSCPSRAVYAVHDTFLCTASDATGSATVQVRVENSSGDVTWQVLSG